ncbi:hypothetical protein MWU52_13785 [Jannaschia sp. S6380]|uniref:hypothetical protein n=1 Tax=Jannaschia sp. S6380 TaxID=2926408 RepID=UPI001FF32422|nr:hypothetical protein [Jannaschia sp. S6380]MCK0168625.1 hypothetical protein [Jannaschia sp. S6380]
MAEFRKTGRVGRTVAAILAYAGWAVVAVGLLLALAGALTGATPGAGAPAAGAGPIARVAAAALGAGIALIGLFAVMMAAQTRAALDTADLTRELLSLTRRRQDPRPAAPVVSPKPVPDAAADDVPPMPPSPRPRLAATEDKPGRKRVHPIFSARPPK